MPQRHLSPHQPPFAWSITYFKFALFMLYSFTATKHLNSVQKQEGYFHIQNLNLISYSLKITEM